MIARNLVNPLDAAEGRRERSSARSTALDRWALSCIQRSVRTAPLRFALWDGFELPSPTHPVAGSILFKSRKALFAWVWDSPLYFGETYMSGDVSVDGDLLQVLEAVYRGLENPSPRPWWLWQQSNDADSARENVHHHYDLGNEFYRLWLDREMVYTCAYFPTASATLEEAQFAKMDLVCRKLHIRRGERIVEAGCGWGALALFMARRYGAQVRAFNLSKEQLAFARARARHEGLDKQVEFIEDDYRNVTGTCDVFVSVGMLEHVGKQHYAALGDVIHRTLTEHGRGFLHFIGRNRPAPLTPWIRKRIFPGAYAPALGEVFERVLEPHAFSVLDVENLRLHYAKTLEHWRARFETSADRVATMFDEEFVRAWRLYLTGSQASFTTGSLQLFQVLFARGGSNQVPWTRVSG
jgi:cyclopropane-fatty-acyl-phospholipid synthase